MTDVIKEANALYTSKYNTDAWFGKCIFLSWYCSLGDCTFCYRSVTKDQISNPAEAKRSLASIYVEALLSKHLNWKLEFLTGGYGIFPFDDLVHICKVVSEIMGEKIWINMGVLSPAQLEKIRPYVEGLIASIETVEPVLHKKVCPNKPIEPFSKMLKNAEGFKKGMTMIVGLGETIDDFPLFEQFIREHNLDKITFYALKPVKGTEYEHAKGPETEYYATWIAKTRLAFPDIEIMAGITPRRAQDVGRLLEAGANAVTKFSATKLFASDRAYMIEEKAKEAGRVFKSSLTVMPDVDWDAAVDAITSMDEESKQATKELLQKYIAKMKRRGR